MAMRPAVRNRSIMLIVFAVVQWLFMRYIVDNQLFNLTTYNRILFFCVSSLGGAFAIFVGLIYMVLKGNPNREEENTQRHHHIGDEK
jgi:hypothetical protein